MTDLTYGFGDSLTAADRDLLAAVHLWARTNGWTAHDWLGWINGPDSTEATVAVRIERVGGCGLSVFVRDTKYDAWPTRATFYEVRSVGEGADQLVELGILPPFPWLACEGTGHRPSCDPTCTATHHGGDVRYYLTAAAYAALGA